MTDTNLYSFNSYDYTYCAKNSNGTTCLDKFTTILTNGSLPVGFDFFNYIVVGNQSVLLEWQTPFLLNGHLIHYILYRDGIEIYKGDHLRFYDDSRHVSPFRAYKYEIEVCNQVGCQMNSMKLAVSVQSKPPEHFKLKSFNVSYSSIQLNWHLPKSPNGVLDKFVLILKETMEEVPISFSFDAENVTTIVSVKNVSVSTIAATAPRVFSTDSQFIPGIVYSVILIDLVPNTQYSVKIVACNQAGCVEANTPEDIPVGYIHLMTDDYYLTGFRDPVVYVIDDTMLNLVWQAPETVNGQLTTFKLYRNNIFLIQFELNETIENNKLSKNKFILILKF